MEFDKDLFTEEEPMNKPAGKHVAPKGTKAPARGRTRSSERTAARHHAAAQEAPAGRKSKGKSNRLVLPAVLALIVILICIVFFLPKKTATEAPAAAQQSANDAPSSTVIIGQSENVPADAQADLPEDNAYEPEVVEPTPTPMPTPRVNWNTGDTVSFGSYKQDTSGNASPLQWKVLERDGDYALLISTNIVKFMKMRELTESTWDESFIRDWLNTSERGYGQLYKKGTSFMGTAFNAEEKAALTALCDVPSSGSPLQDKVFLLSQEEFRTYSPLLSTGCYPTDYAVLEGQRIGLGKLQEGTARWWWLRSTDISQHFRFVNDTGALDERVKDADNDYGGIRPAIWVDLTKVPV